MEDKHGNKKHYKMYKSGKLWVSAAVATLALTAGMAYGPSANADAPQPPTQSAANPTTPAADKVVQANSQNKQGQADPQPTANSQNSNESQPVSGQNNKQDNQEKPLPGKQGTPTNDNKGGAR